jgi:hypothetical protein
LQKRSRPQRSWLLRGIPALIAGALILVFAFNPQFSASGAPILDIDLITWGVIGLDSNNVNAGPDTFPVGARVCNNGNMAATGLVSTFVWDSANAFINTQAGSLTTINVSTLGVGECYDFYYNVVITRNASAYGTTREFHITIDSNETSPDSTPIGYERSHQRHLLGLSRDGAKLYCGGGQHLRVCFCA